MKYINALIATCIAILLTLFLPMKLGAWFLGMTKLTNPSIWWLTWIAGFGVIVAFIIVASVTNWLGQIIYHTLEYLSFGLRIGHLRRKLYKDAHETHRQGNLVSGESAGSSSQLALPASTGDTSGIAEERTRRISEAGGEIAEAHAGPSQTWDTGGKDYRSTPLQYIRGGAAQCDLRDHGGEG
jgi:hypothetical protein